MLYDVVTNNYTYAFAKWCICDEFDTCFVNSTTGIKHSQLRHVTA